LRGNACDGDMICGRRDARNRRVITTFIKVSTFNVFRIAAFGKSAGVLADISRITGIPLAGRQCDVDRTGRFKGVSLNLRSSDGLLYSPIRNNLRILEKRTCQSS
jgi:hypothetical protein